MFCIWILLQKNVDIFQQVRFILSDDQTSFDMYLPLDLMISEPKPVDTSTTYPPTSTTINERPTTPLRQR